MPRCNLCHARDVDVDLQAPCDCTVTVTLTRSELYDVLDAVDRWAAELRDYIAPASDQYSDTESAAAQRENAETLLSIGTRLYSLLKEA